MWKIIFGFLITSGLFVALPLHAAIIYVDKDNACPGSGTSASPYCSIQNAVNAVNPGDTIRIRNAASAYTETIQTGKGGTSANPITVEPDIGHNPRLYNTGNGAGCANFWIYGNYWTIQNLNFDASGQNSCVFGAILIHASGRDVIGHKILNNTFKGWGNSNNNTRGMSAVAVSGGVAGPDEGFWPTDVLVEGNTFDSNRYNNLAIAHTRNTIVRNNEFKGTKCGVGWDATNTLGIHATHSNNWLLVDGNSFHDFEAYSNCTVPLVGWPTYAAYWCDVGGKNAVLKNNIVYNLDPNGNAGDLNKFVAGFFVEAGCESHTLKNNIFSNVKTAAIYSAYHALNPRGPQPPNVYHNNTIYGGAYGFFLKEGVVQIKNNIVKNATSAAICHGCGSGSPSLLQVTYDFNLYDDGANQTKIAVWAGIGTLNFPNWKTNCKCDSHSLNTNPLLVNPPSDFHLQSTSPARSAGENGVDIGALPHISGAPIMPSSLAVTPN